MPQSEVWIAYRGDGLGDGTVGNPYDGGTLAGFDAAMRGLSANTCVHLAPSASPFETNGYYDGIGENVGWRAKPGMRIIGYDRGIFRPDDDFRTRLEDALLMAI